MELILLAGIIGGFCGAASGFLFGAFFGVWSGSLLSLFFVGAIGACFGFVGGFYAGSIGVVIGTERGWMAGGIIGGCIAGLWLVVPPFIGGAIGCATYDLLKDENPRWTRVRWVQKALRDSHLADEKTRRKYIAGMWVFCLSSFYLVCVTLSRYF